MLNAFSCHVVIYNEYTMYIRNYFDCCFVYYFQTYSYDSYDTPTTEWCYDSSENIDIELLTSTSSDYGSFILEVTGVKTYDCKCI